ncbi:ribulokinase [Gracilimonas mengyeensis]|uniref:Ribulokinase n=1 Tax=Gracilimonas mengyeensis TaxID=1302730 RepID=A0A521AY37_9BACT|nr:ribulokinase [Gracilimonas mengyeensis]SMO39763.1 L-ribulokinase [Gracilimonas mengyeensis]
MEYVIGVDYGTDSVRSVLVSENGEEIAESVWYYKRWKQGKYSNPDENRFRHHPLDYLEGLEDTLKEVVQTLDAEERKNIKAISVDSTGSTPVAVDKEGTPLAMKEGFEENPNAMFVLWKDHTAIKESDEINKLARSWGGVDYTKYVGGIYSSEWFWAKILHVLREDEEIRENAYSWVELCDWIPYELTGKNDVHEMKRSRCAAGHKAMWHEEFGGLPSEDFLTQLDPLLGGLRDRLYEDTYTSDKPAGTISKEWAEKLDLPEDVIIGVGAFDAHMGAVGGRIEPYQLVRVMGTSTCDMLVAPEGDVGDNLVQGICGQVDGSVIPGMIGLEAGQSAFGDIYAWFKNMLLGPYKEIINGSAHLNDDQKEALIEEAEDKLIANLTNAAQEIEDIDTGVIALDWMNGRRTPDANQLLKGAIEGLDLSSDAPKIFKALVEATCFGSKKIVDRFIDEGIRIEGVIGMGGVSKKSPFVMQTLANVLNMPIRISKSEQTCALGASVFAATAAGMYSSVEEAKENLASGFEKVYEPEADKVEIYQKMYQDYSSFGEIIEERIMKKAE